jgi:hypothetical protein
VWYSVYLARPKLALAGGGGGGGPGPSFHEHFVQVTNQPGLLGVRLRETIIFGRRIHGALSRVLPFERRAATECRAWLHPKEGGSTAVPLWWRSSDDRRRCVQSVTIGNGETYELPLFARLDSEPSRYFIFAPEEGGWCERPAVPREPAVFDDTREFVVRINYSNGHQRLAFETAMRKQLDGRFRYETKGAASGSF